MIERTVEDRLREEYFALLPDVRRVTEELLAEIRHCLLPISGSLYWHERLVVMSRIKECESALGALRRRQEGATFDSDRRELYTLRTLNDLAGVRVLVFPRGRLTETDQELRKRFSSWVSDPVPGDDEHDEPRALKYHGYCKSSDQVRGEFQIVPMLTGLFWEVEHAAIYKPSPQLKGINRSLEMKERSKEVLRALKSFEEEFERLIRRNPLGKDKEERLP
jgi:ppGpp synthetase/RelA/SpoT-type nucleotidyltranferase